MAVQDLSRITIAYKEQADMGTLATGSGATGLEVTPSSGLQMQSAQVESQLIRRSKMRRKARPGSISVSADYGSELQVGAFDPIIEAVLGGDFASPIELDETDLTSCTITGGGETVTFAAGDPADDGVRVGMMARFSGLSVAANNGVWFPILAMGGTNGRVWTVPEGYLLDNSVDSEFDVEVARSVYTTTPYKERYFTIEEYGDILGRSKLGVDAKWNSFSVSQQPDQIAQISMGLGAREMRHLPALDSPNFTDPAFGGGRVLYLQDGAVYVNGEKRLDLTGLQFGLEAPLSTVPVISSRFSPDIFTGQFGFTGQLTGVVQDGDDLRAFLEEDDISLHVRFSESDNPAAPFISFYFGDLSYGGYTDSAGGEGAQIKTIPLNGGEDGRGGFHAPTTMLVSTSHVPA
jgi:hypothetical protein